MVVKIHEAQSVKARKTALLHLPPRIGAWCWQRKGNRRRLTQRAAARTERSRNCEAGKGTFAILSAGVEDRPLISLEDLLARERTDQEPVHKLSAERVYERRWALTLLDQVLVRLRAEYEAAGKLPLFDR